MATAEEPAPAKDGLRGSVRRGLGFSLLNNALSRLGTVVTGIVLARLLVPEDYGVFAVALVVLSALLSINELGVSLAVVRWPTDPRRIAPTVATMAVAGSTFLYGVAFFSASAVADALGAPAAKNVIILLAISMIIDGAASVPAALLTREFQQGRRMTADLAGLAVNTAVTITLAVYGYGAYSLAFGYLVGNLTTSAVIYVSAPYRVWFGFDRSIVRELLAFGIPLAGSSLLVFGVLNVAAVVVGSQLGAVALGFFTLAFNLSSWPVNMFSMAVRRVAMPAFAQLADDRERLQDSFARSVALLMAVTLPVCTLLAVLALPVVRVVYGGRWAEAADALRWLAVLGSARIVAELAYDLLVAAGRSRAVFVIQGVWLGVLAPALVVGAHLGGIEGVAFAHAAVAVAVVGPAFLLALRGVGLKPLACIRYCGRPLAGAAAIVAIAELLGPRIHGDVIQLLVLSAAGTAAAAALSFPLLRSRRGTPERHRHRRTRGRRAQADAAPTPVSVSAGASNQ
jgi:PST family polysaccharide transporter